MGVASLVSTCLPLLSHCQASSKPCMCQAVGCCTFFTDLSALRMLSAAAASSWCTHRYGRGFMLDCAVCRSCKDNGGGPTPAAPDHPCDATIRQLQGPLTHLGSLNNCKTLLELPLLMASDMLVVCGAFVPQRYAGL